MEKSLRPQETLRWSEIFFSSPSPSLSRALSSPTSSVVFFPIFSPFLSSSPFYLNLLIFPLFRPRVWNVRVVVRADRATQRDLPILGTTNRHNHPSRRNPLRRSMLFRSLRGVGLRPSAASWPPLRR
ncbi:hypothetical protein BJX96DRAFT_161306 [Aspergillus floccosus]